MIRSLQYFVLSVSEFVADNRRSHRLIGGRSTVLPGSFASKLKRRMILFNCLTYVCDVDICRNVGPNRSRTFFGTEFR
jgi:hypothetical protein